MGMEERHRCRKSFDQLDDEESRLTRLADHTHYPLSRCTTHTCFLH